MAIREFLIVSLLLFCGCQSAKSCEVVHVDGADPAFTSARLTFPIRDRVHGMGVHMISTPGQLSTYLEVHLQTIPPHRGNSKEALVKMTMDGKTLRGIAYRHDGGQRVSLSSEMHHLLVEALRQKHPVTLQLEGYSATLDPQDFSEQYEKLQTAPIKNRLQLPFKL
jgi:hypothetical protein